MHRMSPGLLGERMKVQMLILFVVTIIGSAAAYGGKRTTCDVSPSKRIDCGYKGILKETCMNKGCCWDEAARDTACCFYPATQKPDLNCDVGDPTKRYDCGYPDIQKDECLQRDCCWDNSIPNVNWCFYPVRSGPDAPESVVNCSFPYTYDGELYYRCTEDMLEIQPCGCLGHDAVSAVCDACSPPGFEATYSSIAISVPPQPGQVPVMSVFGWIVIHQNLGGEFNWKLPWANYREGFGSHSSTFFLGLENIHRLTYYQSYRLRVEMLADSYLWYSAEYRHFHLDNEVNKYRLNVAGYTGDAGNLLDDDNDDDDVSYTHDGMMFSTVDSDNDIDLDGSCPDDKNGGWWFNTCYKVCLMCNNPRHRCYTLDEVQLLVSRMMIKPIM